MFTKRNRVNDSSIPEKKEKKTPSKEIALTAIFPLLSPYLSGEEAANLAGVKKIFHRLYQNPLIWRNQYLAHFGPFVVEKDYIAQYQAAYLLKQVENISDHAYKMLHNHVLTYAHEPWSLYYQAELARHNNLNDPERIRLGLNALRLGDQRAADFLVSCFEFDLMHEIPIPEDHIYAALKLVDEKSREYGLLYAILAQNSDSVDLQFPREDIALHLFYETLNPKMAVTAEFKKYFTRFFRIIRVMNDETFTAFSKDEIFIQFHTVIEALVYYADKYNFYYKTPFFFNWIERYVDQCAEAAYHYAHRCANLGFFMLAKEGFLKALNGGDYRAAGELYAISLQQPDVISKAEGMICLKKAANHRHAPSIETLARAFSKNKKGFQDPFALWIMQSAICHPRNIPSDITKPNHFLLKIYHQLIKKSDDPSYGSFIHCALAWIYQLRDRNEKKALEHFSLVMISGADWMENYIKIGKEENLFDEACEKAVVELKAANSVMLAKGM